MFLQPDAPQITYVSLKIKVLWADMISPIELHLKSSTYFMNHVFSISPFKLHLRSSTYLTNHVFSILCFKLHLKSSIYFMNHASSVSTLPRNPFLVVSSTGVRLGGVLYCDAGSHGEHHSRLLEDGVWPGGEHNRHALGGMICASVCTCVCLFAGDHRVISLLFYFYLFFPCDCERDMSDL